MTLKKAIRSDQYNPEPENVYLGQRLIGKVNNLVKSVSWEENGRCGSGSENSKNNKMDDDSLSNVQNDDRPDNKNQDDRTVTIDCSHNSLSRSEEFLVQIPTELKRNASDSRLSEHDLRNTSWCYSALLKNESDTAQEKPVENGCASKSESENPHQEIVEDGIQRSPPSESSDTELEEVELRKPKSLSLRRVISRSVRGSIRLVKGMRPKSESEVTNKDNNALSEKYKFLKQAVTAVLENNQPPPILYLQPPAPLVVEDPPSTDEERLHELKNQNVVILNGVDVAPTATNRPPIRKQHSVGCMTDTSMLCFVQGFEEGAEVDNGRLQMVRNKLLRKSRSSGNFGSAGPRSAPATPQGQLGAPQGGQPEALVSPSIQRSPSHSVFSKADKTNLKHLSTSTPVMTAQGQLAEPPSPKATKDPKVHTTSKARQKKFLRHFPNVEEDEKVLNHYSCALIGDILLQGHLYITKNYFAFYSNVFGYVTKLLIPILTVEEITKEKTARIIPNAVGITTTEDKHIFGSLMSRDSTLAYMKTVWEKAKSEEALPEPEITEPDQDSSESGESDRESPVLESIPSGPDILASAKFDRMRKESVRNQIEGSLLERKGSKGFVRTLKDAITEFRKLPRQSLILVATTLLLILLFLSAAVLLYRINKIQNKYSISLQGASLSSTSEDIYSDLLHWQTHLHSRSADAVNNFLDNNLDQIAKVRQSLEALSALLTGQNANPSANSNVQPKKMGSADLKAESVPVNAAGANS